MTFVHVKTAPGCLAIQIEFIERNHLQFFTKLLTKKRIVVVLAKKVRFECFHGDRL